MAGSGMFHNKGPSGSDRDVQRAQYLYLYLYLLRQQNYLFLYLNKSGKRLKNPVFVFLLCF